MECIREHISGKLLNSIISLPDSMCDRELEILVILPESKRISKELRGIAAKDTTLDSARKERLAKYEITS